MRSTRAATATGVLLAASLALGGCAQAEPGDGAPNTPSPGASSAAGDETGTGASAAEHAVAAFVAAARTLDAEVVATGILVNGLFVAEGVRDVDSVSLATMETLDRVQGAAALIPAGLAEEVRVAALQVYQDLLHRAYTLSYVPGYIGNGLYALDHPGDVWTPARDAQELADQARALLAYGGMSKARFAEDLSSLQALAASSGAPAAPVPPDSQAAGLLAFEIASLNTRIQACHPPPGEPIVVTSLLAEWQSVEIGPLTPGSPEIQAYYDPVLGWQIQFPYC